MDTTVKLAGWFSNMDYQGRTPPNLQRICNPSTAIIWEQLINNTRPKQEVEYIRNNILINRILKRDNSTDIPYLHLFQSDYPIKEIVVWDKNVTLKQHIHTAKYRINELDSELADANKQNNIRYINLDHLKEKIQEHHRVSFLLNSKVKILETEINDTEELLKQVRNSTPIEMVEQNDEDVVNTLKMCSEKLCKIIEQQKNISSSGSNITIPLIIPEHSVAAVYSKQICDESLGLLDDSMSFTSAAASSFISAVDFPTYNLAILNDEILNKSLEDQLHNKERRMIWNVINKFSETFKVDLINAIADNDKISPSLTKKDNKEERKLYALHVEYELKIRKSICEIRVLKQELNRLCEISKKNCPEYTQNQLRLHLKKIGLDAASQQIQELINKMQSSYNVKNDLRVANEKASALQDNIETILNSIKHKIISFKEVLDEMFQTRNKISVLMRQLSPFTLDLNWTMPLYSCIISMEVQTFLDFPLKYNMVMLHGDTKTYVRNISLNCIPYQANLDSNFIRMLLALLQNPSVPAEVLLANIIKAILKMNHFKTLLHLPEYHSNLKYTVAELQKQDAYLNFALDKLKSYTSGAHSMNRTGATLSQLNSTVSLWLEMPIKDFATNDQLYNGKSYEYYEKLFESHYNLL